MHTEALAVAGGAGDGNRTHVTSLEGWRTAIVLRPRRAQKVARTGFEPVISGLKGRRPGPLDERAKGESIVPDQTLPARRMVGGEGFEPPTSSMSSWRSTN